MEPASPEALRPGDVVVFLTLKPDGRSQVAAHRLLWKRRGPAGWKFWTKGDTLWEIDASTPESGLIGRVAATRRGAGPWQELRGWRAARARAAGALAVVLALGPAASRLLARALRSAQGRPSLRPVRRAALRLSLLLEDL